MRAVFQEKKDTARIRYDMAVISRMDHRQSLSVIAVRIRAQLVLQLMCLEIGDSSHLQDPVFRHGGIPHQIASGLHIVDIL